MEDDLKILKVEYLSNHWSDLIQNQSVQKHLIEDDPNRRVPQWKMTPMEDDPNGRRPQNIKCRISQQPLVGSYPNFKLKLRRPNQSVD